MTSDRFNAARPSARPPETGRVPLGGTIDVLSDRGAP
jgi:hypothetical protein